MRNNIYLDYNATAPMLQEVQQAILENMDIPLNPSSIHSYGKHAKGLVEKARGALRKALAISDEYQIVFTSGGTEANNLALKGLKDYKKITSTIEHYSVLNTIGRGEIVVDSTGLVNLEQLEGLLRCHKDEPLLVSIMSASNETGVLQPIKEARELCHKYNALFHTDASQAIGKVPFSLEEINADMVTLSGHKFGAPLGVGALIYKKKLPLMPIVMGGGQEYRLRSGTHNTLGIYGLGIAASFIQQRLVKMKQTETLRDWVEREILTHCKGATVFGQASPRLPNTSSISMPNTDSQTQLIHFDMEGISVSAGSACSSGTISLPYVQMAMGYSQELANCTIRVSLGPDTKLEEAEKFVTSWKKLLKNSNKKIA